MSQNPFKPHIAYETHVTEPLAAGSRQIVVQSRVLRLDLEPFGGFIWNRPSAVLVRDADGEQTVPVRDVTRLVQIALLSVGAALIRRKQ